MINDRAINTTVTNLKSKQTYFNALWLAETVRLQEEDQGVLADAEAVRQARQEGGGFEQRILTRAKWLAGKTHLVEVQASFLVAMKWSVSILCVLAFFTGIGLIVPTFSAQTHTINIFSAVGCLLGLNVVMLVIWVLSSLVGGQSINQLGKFGLWLTSKLTGKKQVVQLVPALFGLLHRQKLEKWWLGRLSNGVWLLISTVALISLLLLLASQRYGFIWQTTLLSADSFVAIVHGIGFLPSQFGFPLPDEALIRNSGNTPVMLDSARQIWAAWLVGVLVVYGILPRLMLFVLCSIMWSLGIRKLSLDLDSPGYALLKPRLLPDSELVGVTDAVPEHWMSHRPIVSGKATQGSVLVGIELDRHIDWPLVRSEYVHDAGIVETREQRKQLLEALTFSPVARLLIICDVKRSVDRGTLSLISELAHCAKEVKVGLIIDDDTDAMRLANWQESLQPLQLEVGESDAFLDWLGGAS